MPLSIKNTVSVNRTNILYCYEFKLNYSVWYLIHKLYNVENGTYLLTYPWDYY